MNCIEIAGVADRSRRRVADDAPEGLVLAGRHRLGRCCSSPSSSEARLYGAMGLQVVYVGLSVYGWYAWVNGRAGRTARSASRRPRGARSSAAAAAGVVGRVRAGGCGSARRTDEALPITDAATTSFSLVAQWMQTRKLIENWWVWLVVDIVYVGMNLSQGAGLDCRAVRRLRGARASRASASGAGRWKPVHDGRLPARSSSSSPARSAPARRRWPPRWPAAFDAPLVAGVRREYVDVKQAPARRVGRRADRAGPAGRRARGRTRGGAAERAGSWSGTPTSSARSSTAATTTARARSGSRRPPANGPDDLYLLLCPDVPWVADGLQRDRPTRRHRAPRCTRCSATR